MNKLDPVSQSLFDFHQSMLQAQGVLVEVEDVAEALLWLRVKTRPDLVSVLSSQEARTLVDAVFKPLPYQVFITLVPTNRQDDYTGTEPRLPLS